MNDLICDVISYSAGSCDMLTQVNIMKSYSENLIKQKR